VHRTPRLVTGLATTALIAGGALAVAPASEAASRKITASIDCPKAFPTASAVKGVKGTGFTVESGTKPAPFAATIIGRITDAIEPGTDLIMARLSSPAITRARGIWAGISGSPVYSSDGRLIGSVSYGLGINSDIAGLTPASALLPVLSGVPRATAGKAGPRHIALSRAQVSALTQAGGSAAAAESGFTRIPLPLAISGKATKQLLNAVKAMPDVRLVQGAARASTTAAKPTQIHAGGNFVAALSYGDATAAGIGTTTVVCKGKAVAFGHPFFSDGATQMTAHGATAVYVQPDSLFGAFKLANLTGPVGVVDTDRTTGIRAVLGAKPAFTTNVTSSFRLGSRAAVKGSTVVAYPMFAGQAAGGHVFLHAVKVLGYEGRGSAAVTFVIKGVRGNGKAFSITRKDVYSDTFDLPAQLAQTVFFFVDPLARQEFENLRITSVAATGTFQTVVNRYSVSKVEAQQGGTWVALGSGSVQAKAGSTLPLRVTLTPYKGVGAKQVVSLPLPVPASAAGGSAALLITAGLTGLDTSRAGSVDEILSILGHAPTNDQLTARLIDDTGSSLSAVTKHVGAAVTGYENGWSVSVS
jgi:hypothetical protein